MRYVDYVYDIVRLDCEGMDAIYKDYILYMLGVYGFNILHQERLIEGCGVVNGRQLYTLVKKEPVEDIPEVEQLKRENKKLRELLTKGF